MAFFCAAIDLTKIGSQNLTADQWYAGIVRSLVSSFELSGKCNLRSWWRDRDHISPVQRLSEFIEGVLLVEIAQNIVIFVDEIDSVLSLNFSIDDFFACIRDCFNQRADKPQYRRLTFTLLGVATPSDLISDKNRTPFNIGRAIQLTGFGLHEAQPLAEGLAQKAENDQEVLREILAWTGGQPFLTQKLCKLVLTAGEEPPQPPSFRGEQEWIEQLVRSHIIENWESQDEPEHLRTIRDRILRDQQRAGRRLGLYQQILQQGEITADDSYDQIELRLSGLVIEQQGKLRVYNRIYGAVFNQDWVDQALADLRPYAALITAWLASNCNDKSRLLRGRALRDAQAWAVGKSLGDKDYQFLAASQELDKREVLEAERQAQQILAKAQRKAELALEEERKANQGLAEAQRKTKQQMHLGAVAMAIMLGIAAIAWVFAQKTIRAANQQAVSATKTADQTKKDANTKTQQAQDYVRVAEYRQGQAEGKAKQAQQKAKAAVDQQKQAEHKKAIAEEKLAEASAQVHRFGQERQEAQHKVQEADQKLKSARQDVDKEKKNVQKIKEYGQKLTKKQKTLEKENQEIKNENDEFYKNIEKEKSYAEKSDFSYLLGQVKQEHGNIIIDELRPRTFLAESVLFSVEVEQEHIRVKRGDKEPLQRDNRGPEVVKLQDKLKELGCYEAPITGYFGWLTELAVRRFQVANQVEQLDIKDIIVDYPFNDFSDNPNDSTLIQIACGSIWSRSLRLGSSGSDVRQLQDILIKKNFYSGSRSGFFGSNTEAAVRQFQLESGLLPDGIAGRRTLLALSLYNPGDYSLKVLALQKKLREAGINSVPIHGIYDNRTAESVRRFQKERSLVANSADELKVIFNALGLGELTRNSYIVIRRIKTHSQYPSNDERGNASNTFLGEKGNSYINEGVFPIKEDANKKAETLSNNQSNNSKQQVFVVDRERALESVFRLQHWLKNNKFYKGSLDGIWSYQTQKAVKDAQDHYK